jgi:hypothetical protein
MAAEDRKSAAVAYFKLIDAGEEFLLRLAARRQDAGDLAGAEERWRQLVRRQGTPARPAPSGCRRPTAAFRAC